MKRLIAGVIVAIVVILGAAGNSWAQLDPPNSMGVSMGHLHYNVKDIDVNRKFWIAMGAKPVMMGGTREVLRFSGVMVLLTKAESTGGTEGSVVNHVGFRVPNTVKMLDHMKSLGYKTELAASATGKVGSVYSPEDERIELLEDQSINVKFVPDSGQYKAPAKMTVPIALHHVHFFVPDGDVEKIQAWYVKVFGAVPGKRFRTELEGYTAADLPGVNLNISGGHVGLPGINGRRLTHIGFEIRNLEAFCKKLEAMGIKLDRPYSKLPIGIANAYVTDPWGTYIELTEGLNRL